MKRNKYFNIILTKFSFQSLGGQKQPIYIMYFSKLDINNFLKYLFQNAFH
tara:strand:+ start:2565 stop:2714 length:150 start_codon:yes stop_codon:yes gene_type:complete